MAKLGDILKTGTGLVLAGTLVGTVTDSNHHNLGEPEPVMAEVPIAHAAMAGRIALGDGVSLSLISYHAEPHSVVPAPNLSTVEGRVNFIVKDLTKHGVTKIGTAATLGNWAVEDPRFLPNRPGGYVAQLQGQRLEDEQRFADAHHEPEDSLQAEVGYTLQELKNGPYAAGDYSRVLRMINKATSPQEAAEEFSEYYEEPSIPNLSARETQAYDYYVRVVKKAK